MSKKSQELKKLLIEKLGELTMLGQAQGAMTGDGQILFIVDTIQVVLEAGMDESEARLLHQHVQNFLNELQMVKGEIPVNEYVLVTHHTSVN